MDGAERLAQILLVRLRLIANRFDKEIEILQSLEDASQDHRAEASPAWSAAENQSKKGRQDEKDRRNKGRERGETTARSTTQSCVRYSASGPARPWTPTR
jgi:hypothetical protein